MKLTAKREAYERAPDGLQWPGTLDGLKRAIDETVLRSAGDPATTYVLQVIIEGQSHPFTRFRDGVQLR